MFATISALVPADRDYPARTRRLDLYRRVLDGTFYDALPYAFHDERTAGGEYVPLRQRRPSVRYPLARIVVEDSQALVFGAGHFPVVECDDHARRAVLARIGDAARLHSVMLEAGLKGAVGSVAILLRVLRGRVFLAAMDSLYLTPRWEAEAPDLLRDVTERYKVTGAVLAAQGYEIADPGAEYWFMRVWDAQTETWFLPWAVNGGEGPLADASRSVRHGLGFVPLVWIRNLPGGDDIDGGCTFRAAIDSSIEIDYQLSQAGRGLKYSSDPLLLIREPAGSDGEIVRGGGNALVVSEKGDAKLLEIGGSAADAVIAYVRTLREMALEGVHGNRASADRISAAQSGRALEMMNQGLLWLAGNLRVSYGDGLLAVVRMIVRASRVFALTLDGVALGPLDDVALRLDWPSWYPATPQDLQAQAASLATLVGAGVLSQETAVRVVAAEYGISDVTQETERVGRGRMA